MLLYTHTNKEQNKMSRASTELAQVQNGAIEALDMMQAQELRAMIAVVIKDMTVAQIEDMLKVIGMLLWELN
jgi:hypothetical protein